jgi:hypothetical protein
MSTDKSIATPSRSRIWSRDKRARGYIDTGLDLVVPRKCRFTFFRVGVDLCAKCQRTRKEHHE